MILSLTRGFGVRVNDPLAASSEKEDKKNNTGI